MCAKWSIWNSNGVSVLFVFRISSSDSHFPVDSGQYPRVRGNLHRKKSPAYWQSIFGFPSHCRSVRRVTRYDIRWRKWHFRWVIAISIMLPRRRDGFTFTIELRNIGHVNRIKSQFPFFAARQVIGFLVLNFAIHGLHLMSCAPQHQYWIYVPYRWIDIFT